MMVVEDDAGIRVSRQTTTRPTRRSRAESPSSTLITFTPSESTRPAASMIEHSRLVFREEAHSTASELTCPTRG